MSKVDAPTTPPLPATAPLAPAAPVKAKAVDANPRAKTKAIDHHEAAPPLPLVTALAQAVVGARKDAFVIAAPNFWDNILDVLIVVGRWLGLTNAKTRTFEHVVDADDWRTHAAMIAAAGGNKLRQSLARALDQECLSQLSAIIAAAHPLPPNASPSDRAHRAMQVASAAGMALVSLRSIYKNTSEAELALVAPALNGPTLANADRVSLATLLAAPREKNTHAILTLLIRDCPECAEPPLPDRVIFKTKTEATTPFYFFAVRGGRLWMKPNPDAGESGPWRVLGDGRPDKWYWRHQPARITSISADGSYLVAKGNDGVFYSLRWSTLGVTGWGSLIAVGRGNFVWTDSWGFPLKPFEPKLSTGVRQFDDFHMSSRTRHNVGYCEDGNGYHHRFDFGCDEVITLSQDGTLFDGIDPWLGAEYHLRFTSPEQGKARIVSYDSSASTTLAMDDRGRIFTRMFDFDISGQDHYFFGYTWRDKDSHYMRRRLPLPDWVEQPKVPGQTTSKLTITTTPGKKGNAARTLIVEGIDGQGHTGYFTKGIADKAWTFVPTGEPLSGRLVVAPLASPATETTAGHFDVAAHGMLGEVPVALSDFNLYAWQPAPLRIGDAVVTVNINEIKSIENGTASLIGALLVDDPSKLPPALARAFGKEKFATIQMTVAEKRVTIAPAGGPTMTLDADMPLHVTNDAAPIPATPAAKKATTGEAAAPRPVPPTGSRLIDEARHDSRFLPGQFISTLALKMQRYSAHSDLVCDVFKTLNAARSAELALEIFRQKGGEQDEVYADLGGIWLSRLPLETRAKLLEGLREDKPMSARQSDLFNRLWSSYTHDLIEHQLKELQDPAKRAARRARWKNLLAVGKTRTITFNGVTITVPVIPSAARQLALEEIYKLVELPTQRFNTPEAVKDAMKPPVTTHLASGTQIIRPGLGNVAPSAAWLFRQAQYLPKDGKMIMAFSKDDGGPLRPLEVYKGVPVPPELRGKLFAIGQDEHLFQDYRTGAGILIDQLERVRRDAAKYDIDFSNLHAIAHSQGNIEVALAGAVLAGNGMPEVFKSHNAIAPAFRGSLFADNAEPLYLATRALGGEDAEHSVRMLDPDAAAGVLDEVLRLTVDSSFTGVVDPRDMLNAVKMIRQTGNATQFPDPMMMINSALFANANLGPFGGSDGMVDPRSADFVAEEKNFVVSDNPYSHMGIFVVPQAVDERMRHVPAPDPHRRDILRLVAMP